MAKKIHRSAPSVGLKPLAPNKERGGPKPTAPPRTTLTLPKTKPSDRQRLEHQVPVEGSNVAAARLRQAASPNAETWAAALPPKLLEPFEKALGAMDIAHRREAESALDRLSGLPHAKKLAVSILTGVKAKKIDDAAIDRFIEPTIPKSQIGSKLAAWGRNYEAVQAVSYLQGDFRRSVLDAINAHPDPAAVRKALDFIETGTPRKHRAEAIREKIAAGGAGAAGADIVLALAGLPQSHATPGAARKYAAKAPIPTAPVDHASDWVEDSLLAQLQTFVVQRGLTTSSAWAEADDVQRAGMIGEAVRLFQIHGSKTDQNHFVAQGVEVIHRPKGLDQCKTRADAVNWCDLNGHSPKHLKRLKTKDGTFFCFRLTEIDFAVFEKTDGKLRPVRFENVKTGPSAADKADRQNMTAVKGFLDDEHRYLFPSSGGLVDRSDEIVRDQAVRDQLQLVTVGPTNGRDYDANLPIPSRGVNLLKRRLERT